MEYVYHASVQIDGEMFEALGHSRSSSEICLKAALHKYSSAKGWAHGWYENVSLRIKVSKIRMGRGYCDGAEIT